MAAAGEARHRLPAGDQIGRQGFSSSCAINKAGYGAVWRGQQTWNGVAILARKADPVLTRTALPGDPNDNEARYIEAAVKGILMTSLYLPNGNPQPGPKFDYKLAWFRRLKSHAAKLLKQDIPVVLAGDYNVAPTEQDIYPTRSWDKDALIQPKSRAAFKSLLAQGWCDAIRSAPSIQADVHVLGLQAPALAARRRPAARSSPAQSWTCAAADQGGRRSPDAGRRRRQRSRASLDCALNSAGSAKQIVARSFRGLKLFAAQPSLDVL